MVEQVNTSISASQETKKGFDLMASLKSLFSKSKKSGEKSGQTTRVFKLTRKDSIISICLAFVIIVCAILYGTKVRNEYNDMNSNIEPLKDLSTYNVNLDDNNLSAYFEEGNGIMSINSLITARDNIKEEISEYEIFENNQRDYYEVLLQNLYLPSVNIWKDPYTKNFDVTILGQKYLDTDQFQNLYLIQYWSDFFKYVGNDADYNTIENVSIGDKVVLEDNPNYFYTPISISFSSPNKRSFLLLVNKLSITSNQNNISLLNEFFFYLLNNIKIDKSSAISKLMQEYRLQFSSSTDTQRPHSIQEMTEEQANKYRDMVIGYNLYHWIKNDGIVKDSESLVDDSIIVKTIRQAASCDGSDKQPNRECFYNFRDKYRDIPYLAYNVGMEKQANRTSGLLNFVRDLPPAIAITNFQFEKHSNSSFLNNEEEKYEGSVTFNAYGRNITQDELDEAAGLLGILCFGNNTNNRISPEVALSLVNDYIVSLGGNRQFSNVLALGELKGLLEGIQGEYDGLTNYDKMVKLFEIRRMLNDANLCEHK